MIKVQESARLNQSDLMHSYLEIDRRMVDYCVALDTEFGALVEGSALYTPTVTLDQVVLPENTKQLILDTIQSMEEFQQLIKKLGLQNPENDRPNVTKHKVNDNNNNNKNDNKNNNTDNISQHETGVSQNDVTMNEQKQDGLSVNYKM